VLLGFAMDTSALRTEVANCLTIYNKYWADIILGAVDPDVAVPQFYAEMQTAGYDKIKAELQRQIDEYFK
jgi:putative aldouronate transport system substrate-binding protein